MMQCELEFVNQSATLRTERTLLLNVGMSGTRAFDCGGRNLSQ